MAGVTQELTNRGCDVDRAEVADLIVLYGDLARLQSHTGRFFPLTEVPDPPTCALIRAICVALDGGNALDPRHLMGFRAEFLIDPEGVPDLKPWIGKSLPMSVTQDVGIGIGDDQLLVAGMRLSNPDVVLLGAALTDDGLALSSEWPAGKTVVVAPRVADD